MNFKKMNHKLHLWLGLPSAVIVFFICLSGSLFVFCDEIRNFANRDISTVTPQPRQVTVDAMLKTVKESYPKYIIIQCFTYKEKDKAVLFIIGSRETGKSYVYINPYTGQITGESRLVNLFSMTAHFHKQLLLKKAGAWIVLVASVIFIIELITGLVMWWPKKKSKKYFKNSLTIKRNVPSLRRIIDLHRVFGLYFILVMLLLSVSGVTLFCLPKEGIEAQKHGLPVVKTDTTRQPLPFALIISPLMQDPNVKMVKTELWNIDQSSRIQCIAGTKTGIVTFTGTPYLVDKYTGEKFTDTQSLKDLKIRNTFRKLHVGDWLGWFGKLITFFTGLAGAFLAVSGIIIWGKKKF
jgi:uncharacterized iron-regulated membrane protein